MLVVEVKGKLWWRRILDGGSLHRMQQFLLGTLVGYIGRSVKISDSVDARGMARCIGLLRSNGLLRNSRVVYDTVLQLETSLNCLGLHSIADNTSRVPARRVLSHEFPFPFTIRLLSFDPTFRQWQKKRQRTNVTALVRPVPPLDQVSLSCCPPKTTFLRLPRPSALAAEVRATNKWGPMPGTSSSQ